MKVIIPCSAKLTKLLVANLLILGTGTSPMELARFPSSKYNIALGFQQNQRLDSGK